MRCLYKSSSYYYYYYYYSIHCIAWICWCASNLCRQNGDKSVSLFVHHCIVYGYYFGPYTHWRRNRTCNCRIGHDLLLVRMQQQQQQLWRRRRLPLPSFLCHRLNFDNHDVEWFVSMVQMDALFYHLRASLYQFVRHCWWFSFDCCCCCCCYRHHHSHHFLYRLMVFALVANTLFHCYLIAGAGHVRRLFAFV